VKFANSAGFLSTQVTKNDVELAFQEEMAAMSTSDRLAQLTAKFSVMFAALPKNEFGNIDNPTVRYAIHRYFSANFGWRIQGLTMASDGWNSSSSTSFMKSRVSNFIFELFEKQLNGKGFDVTNLAVFASVMEDLVNREALNIVDKVIELMRVPMHGIETSDFDRVIAVFNAASLMGEFTLEQYSDIAEIEKEVYDVYPRFDSIKTWMVDVRHEHDWNRLPTRNPFMQHQYGYSDIVQVATRVMHSIGLFEMAECRALKGNLIDMDSHEVGRVPLADYYASGEIDFHESKEFLREVGSLDVSNPNLPSIIIPNFLAMSGNCAMATAYYSVCCFDECEGLMQQLEVAIRGPSAPAALIADIVSKIPSDTVEAPRNLSTLLTGRLNEIEKLHGGEVLLHGRLFMQWMHHAFPRECLFPHVSGTVNADAVWEEASAAEKEMHMVKNPLQSTMTRDDSIKSLPWSSVEELVAGNRRPARKSGMMGKVRFIVGVMALVTMMVPLLRSSKVNGVVVTHEKVLSV